MAGIDMDLRYDIIRYIRFVHRASVIYGRDVRANEHLIYMPPVEFSSEVTFQTGKLQRIENLFLSLIHHQVLRQRWFPENADFIPPPKGYQLWHIYAGITVPFKAQNLSVIFQADNVFNVAYRNYLDRFRYYADNMGRNFSIKIRYLFSLNNKNKSS
jgi:iron complex outermembrane receptor protein